MPDFSYQAAYSRNIGWVTPAEQQKLRQCRVAIAGMGGVGGVHLVTLARLGIGRFHIADLDTFDTPNINRQIGASAATLGQAKIDVMARMATDINPEIELGRFDQGVNRANIAPFLDGVDVYVDGLDFFAFDAREAIFAACAERGIPAITVAPIGMSAALMVFMPGGMTFEQYFGWAGQTDHEKALRFAFGLAPALLHRTYLAEPGAFDLANRKTPSTGMACQLCSGIAATEALKVLLGRGTVKAAPHGMQFDAYRGRLVHTWRPGGHRNPLQKLTLAFGRHKLASMKRGQP